METREVTIKTTIPTRFMNGCFAVLPSYSLILAETIMGEKDNQPTLWHKGTNSKEKKRIEIENFWMGNIEKVEGEEIYGLSDALLDLWLFRHGWGNEYYDIYTGNLRKPFSRSLGLDTLTNLATTVDKEIIKEKELIELLDMFWWFVREPDWWKEYILVYTDHEQHLKVGPREYTGKKRPTTGITLNYWIIALVKWKTQDYKTWKYKDWKRVVNPSVHVPKQCMED
jgi:hypothetical protein